MPGQLPDSAAHAHMDSSLRGARRRALTCVALYKRSERRSLICYSSIPDADISLDPKIALATITSRAKRNHIVAWTKEAPVKRVLPMIAALLLPIAAETQTPPTRVALSSTSTVPSRDLRRGFRKKCPAVILNRDPSRADYALEAIEKTTNLISATEVSRYRFTLFNRAGNAIYSTFPHKFSNAVNNVCMALARQRAKDAAASAPLAR
jgi:hypothetical protein